MLNDPWGLQIARKVLGSDERKVDGRTLAYKKYWYTNYRIESLVELQEFVESTMTKKAFEQVKQPVLMLYYYKNETGARSRGTRRCHAQNVRSAWYARKFKT